MHLDGAGILVEEQRGRLDVGLHHQRLLGVAEAECRLGRSQPDRIAGAEVPAVFDALAVDEGAVGAACVEEQVAVVLQLDARVEP